METTLLFIDTLLSNILLLFGSILYHSGRPLIVKTANKEQQTRELELVSILFSLFLKLCLEKISLEANVLTSIGEKLFRLS